MKFSFNEELAIDPSTEPFSREGLRIGLYGAPGSTKSYTAAAFAIEPFLDQGGTVIIFQPRAEWHTLKARFPDIQVIGGPFNQDVPFAASHPKLYADAVVEQGISMIFYTPDVDDEEKLINFVDKFLDYVMKAEEVKHRPLMVILEEAHEYASRSPAGHVAPPWVFNRMVKRCKDLWTGGRKLGMIPIAITQRPQELHFTIRQLCNLSLYGSFSPQDIAYIDKECLSHYRKEGLDIDANRLKNLKAGEFLIIHHGEALYGLRTVSRRTPHGADTPSLLFVPEASEKTKTAVSELGTRLKELLEKEQAEESELDKSKRAVKELEKQVGELNEKVKLIGALQDLKGVLGGNGDPEMRKAYLDQQAKDMAEELHATRRDDEKEGLRDDLLTASAKYDQVNADYGKLKDEHRDILGKFEATESALEKLSALQDSLNDLFKPALDAMASDFADLWGQKIITELKRELTCYIDDKLSDMQPKVVIREQIFTPQTSRGPYAEWLKRLPRSYSKTLQLLLEHPEGLTLGQLGILTGKKVNSLQRHDLYELGKAGLIVKTRDLVKVKTLE